MEYFAIALGTLFVAGLWDGWRRYLEAQSKAREFEKSLALELSKELRAAVAAERENVQKYQEAIKNFLDQQQKVTGFMVDRVAKSEGKVLNGRR